MENPTLTALSNIIICDKIFSNLSTKDLGSCRLVCPFWKSIISHLDNYGVVAIYDEDSLDKLRMMKRYLQSKPKQFLQQFLQQLTKIEGRPSTFIFANSSHGTVDFLLRKMRENGSPQRIRTSDQVLISFRKFGHHVTIINVHCSHFSTVTSFVFFVGMFPQLKSLILSKSIKFDCQLQPASTLLSGQYECSPGLNTRWRLKKFYVDLDSISEELLFIFKYLLQGNCDELEEFKLKLNKIRFRHEPCAELIAKILTKSAPSLKKLVLDFRGISMCPLILYLAKLNQQVSQLEYLEIKCQDLEKLFFFRGTLMPWLQSCHNLKQLRLSPVRLYLSFPFEMKEIIARGCDVKVDVKINFSVSILLRRMLLGSTRNMIRAIEFSQEIRLNNYFESNDFAELESLTLNFKYDECRKVWNLPAQMTSIFPNLIHLSINGDHVDFRDYEIQLIMQQMVQLQSLKIYADLRSLTDFGTTGRWGKEDRTCYPDSGISFSSLPKLRVLLLCKIGNLVTYKTLKHGFNGLKYLNQVTLFGELKISKARRRRFQKEHKNAQIHIGETYLYYQH